VGRGFGPAVDRRRALVNRGEIWWVEDPESGRRPHLVLTRQAAVASVHSVIAIPATRSVRGIPTEVELGRDDGMPDDCVLTVDSTTLMPKLFFRERICVLGPEPMARVCRALALATGCA